MYVLISVLVVREGSHSDVNTPRSQAQGKAHRAGKYSILDAACIQMQFLYDLVQEVGATAGWVDPAAGARNLVLPNNAFEHVLEFYSLVLSPLPV